MKKTAIALIPLLYTAMICPGRKREHPILKVKHFAHRGFHGEAGIPENSMAAGCLQTLFDRIFDEETRRP